MHVWRRQSRGGGGRSCGLGGGKAADGVLVGFGHFARASCIVEDGCEATGVTRQA